MDNQIRSYPFDFPFFLSATFNEVFLQLCSKVATLVAFPSLNHVLDKGMNRFSMLSFMHILIYTHNISFGHIP